MTNRIIEEDSRQWTETYDETAGETGSGGLNPDGTAIRRLGLAAYETPTTKTDDSFLAGRNLRSLLTATPPLTSDQRDNLLQCIGYMLVKLFKN